MLSCLFVFVFVVVAVVLCVVSVCSLPVVPLFLLSFIAVSVFALAKKKMFLTLIAHHYELLTTLHTLSQCALLIHYSPLTP